MNTTTTRKTERQAQTDAAIASLRELFPIGSTVHTKLLHVSRSGMLRSFAVLVPEGNSIRDVSGLVARAIGARLHQPTGGVAMGGCGMDMGYALTYSLARALYRDGFPCTGSDGYHSEGVRCPSNDHSNGDRDYTAGRLHSNPGYALTHRHV
jgi:hypothetical protein